MGTKLNRIIVTLITIAVLTLISGPAGATEAQVIATDSTGSVVLKVKVSYRDLNLSHQEGVVTFYKRINHAAKQVCGHRPDIMDLHRSALYNACRNDTVDRAVNDVGHPGLAALHQKITNGTGSPVLAGTSMEK
ncbi:MAG: UrcA family protein [Deltaproteobacteria bacterium]|nr:UrcA family protein [Deltaproteobacteria bacterium]